MNQVRRIIGKEHPLSNLFPLMQGEAFEAFVNDIRINGQREPIVMHDGLILDGRNRWRACKQLGIAADTMPLEAGDPLAYVISANLHRRHLDESQRGMIASKLETMKHGDNQHTRGDANLHVLRADAARLLNVSTRTVASASVVRDKGSPELIEAAEQGAISVSLAAKVAELPAAEQRAAVAAPKKAVGAVKRFRRARRQAELADATEQAAADLDAEIFNVLYADPPWQFAPYSRDTGMDRAADNHYPTMETADLCNLQVPAADDAVLFLWATVPMLPEALAVMTAWGFTYKSHFVWVKDRIGTGYWNRNQHELLLIGTRGDIPAPAPGEQFPSVIQAKVGEHSEKPAVFADMIEEMFPKLRAVELFARTPRLGWAVWGNEVCS